MSDSATKGSAFWRVSVGNDQPKGFTYSFNGTPDKAHKLIRQPYEETLRPWLTRLPDNRGEQEGYCPLHEDPIESTPSASFNFDKDVWYCHSNPDCPSGPLGELVWRIGHEDRTPPDPGKLLPPSETAPLPTEANVAGWHSALLSEAGAVSYLQESRGLTAETLERFGIGWDGRSIVFPVWDAERNLVNLRRREPGSGRKVIGLKGHRAKIAYPLPAFIEAVEEYPEAALFICEGELDALVLWEHGFPALTTTGGAGALADVVAEHRDLFEGRTVVVWTDHDGPGADARAAVAEVLAPVADHIVLVENDEPQEGQDVTDAWRQEGYRFGEAVERLVRHGLESDDAPSSTWAPVSLGDYMRGEVEAEPATILRREDGEHLLYEGKLQSLAGESESAKTWLALIACVELLEQKRHVLFIDFEDDARSIATRLAALGVEPETVDRYFLYVRPDDPLTTETAARAFERALDSVPVALTIIDGITEVMALHGWDPLNNADTANFIQLLPRPLIRAGSAVLLLDHLPLNNAGRRHAIGGQHKLAALTGTGLRIDPLQPFGRGMEGRFRVRVTKDKGGGFVRAMANADNDVAVLHLFSDAETGQVTHTLEPPIRSTAPSGRVSMTTGGVTEEDASAFYPSLIKYLREHGPTTQNDLVDVKGLLRGSKQKRCAILAVAAEDEVCPVAVRGTGGNDDPLTYYLDGEG